jgi:hypothetical protein
MKSSENGSFQSYKRNPGKATNGRKFKPFVLSLSIEFLQQVLSTSEKWQQVTQDLGITNEVD